MQLFELSIDPLSVITGYLLPTEIIALSHTCTHMYTVLQSDIIWTECLKREDNLKKLALRNYLRVRCPDFIIINCGFAFCLCEYAETISEDSIHQYGYKLVCIQGEDREGGLPDTILDEEKYKLFTSLNTGIKQSIIFYNRQGCGCWECGYRCTCYKDAMYFTKHNIRCYNRCRYFGNPYMIVHEIKRGIHYIIINYDFYG